MIDLAPPLPSFTAAILRPAEPALWRPSGPTGEADLFQYGPALGMAFMPGLRHFSGAAGGNDAFTKLLLHCDGADASTSFANAAAGASHTAAAAGNAQVDTAQSKFGGASALFDGTGDYLTIAHASELSILTQNFSVDFWVRFNAIAERWLIDKSGISGSKYPNWGIGVGEFGAGKMTAYIGDPDGSTNTVTATTTMTTGTWIHIAWQRVGSVHQLFVNGVQEGGNGAVPSLADAVAGPVRIGMVVGQTVGLNGWLDEIRVSSGIARWPGNFTPPGAAYF